MLSFTKTSFVTLNTIMATERLWQQISGSDHQFSQYCDFSLWDELGYHPEYRDTCTYKHFTWAWENKDGDCCTWEKTEHTSYKPWCPSKTGGGVTDWQYCTCEFVKFLTNNTGWRLILQTQVVF